MSLTIAEYLLMLRSGVRDRTPQAWPHENGNLMVATE